jgi:hypothetical protein
MSCSQGDSAGAMARAVIPSSANGTASLAKNQRARIALRKESMSCSEEIPRAESCQDVLRILYQLPR